MLFPLCLWLTKFDFPSETRFHVLLEPFGCARPTLCYTRGLTSYRSGSYYFFQSTRVAMTPLQTIPNQAPSLSAVSHLSSEMVSLWSAAFTSSSQNEATWLVVQGALSRVVLKPYARFLLPHQCMTDRPNLASRRWTVRRHLLCRLIPGCPVTDLFSVN